MRWRAAMLLVAALGLEAVDAQTGPTWWDLNSLGGDRPSPRRDAAMAPNHATGEVVLFGGIDGGVMPFNDTWVWSSAGWQRRLPHTSPSPMAWSEMVYDSWRQRIVLVGWNNDRADPTYGAQTWFWNGDDWLRLPVNGPDGLGAYIGFSMAFDERSGDVVLHGGFDITSGAALDSTWIFDGAQWAWAAGSNPPDSFTGPVPPSPPARGYGAMAYDRHRQEIVLHGGSDPQLDDALTDTWVWLGRAAGWAQRLPVVSPPASWIGYQLANDLLNRRLIAVGCPYPYCSQSASPAVWGWDGENWSLVRASDESGGPLTDDGLSLAEIPYYDGVLLFGGFKSGFVNGTWAWGHLPQLFNKAPVAVIGPPGGGTVLCTAPGPTPVRLDGSQSYDPDNQPLTHQWNGPFGTASGPTPVVGFGIGLSAVTLTVSDGDLTAAASTTVTVALTVNGLESPLGALVPLSDTAPLPTASFQAGRTLPLKLDLLCGTQKLTSSDVSPPRVASVSRIGDYIAATGAIAPATNTDDGSGFFRSENTNWTYNLSTNGFMPGAYELVIEMPDGLFSHTVFSLR